MSRAQARSEDCWLRGPARRAGAENLARSATTYREWHAERLNPGWACPGAGGESGGGLSRAGCQHGPVAGGGAKGLPLLLSEGNEG